MAAVCEAILYSVTCGQSILFITSQICSLSCPTDVSHLNYATLRPLSPVVLLRFLCDHEVSENVLKHRLHERRVQLKAPCLSVNVFNVEHE